MAVPSAPMRGCGVAISLNIGAGSDNHGRKCDHGVTMEGGGGLAVRLRRRSGAISAVYPQRDSNRAAAVKGRFVGCRKCLA